MIKHPIENVNENGFRFPWEIQPRGQEEGQEVVQSAPICWSITARQWTTLGVFVSMLSSWITALIFVLILIEVIPVPKEIFNELGICDEIICSKEGITTMIWAGLVCSAISYFLSAIFWYGVKKENVCLLTFMIILICLGIFGVALNLFMVSNLTIRLAYLLSLGFHVFFLLSSLKFRKEILEATINKNYALARRNTNIV